MKLDEDWPLLFGKKFSDIAALEVEKKLDTVLKDFHYVTQILTETKIDVAEVFLQQRLFSLRRIGKTTSLYTIFLRSIGKTSSLYTIFLSKELVLMMKYQGWITLHTRINECPAYGS